MFPMTEEILSTTLSFHLLIYKTLCNTYVFDAFYVKLSRCCEKIYIFVPASLTVFSRGSEN